MKSLFLIISLFAAMSANAFIGNVGHSTALDFAKNVIPETVEKQFLNVKAASAVLAGQVVSLDLTADDGATVVVGPVTGLAPVCIAVNAIAAGALGKCQRYGLFDAALFDSGDGAATAGKKVAMSSGNAGYIAARATALATDVSIGYFYDSASASGAVQIFINL